LYVLVLYSVDLCIVSVSCIAFGCDMKEKQISLSRLYGLRVNLLIRVDIGTLSGPNPIHQHVDPTRSNPLRIFTTFTQSKSCATMWLKYTSNKLHIAWIVHLAVTQWQSRSLCHACHSHIPLWREVTLDLGLCLASYGCRSDIKP